MATITKQRVQPVCNLSEAAPVRLRMLEAANQTFKCGELVNIVGGYVTECGDNPTLIAGFAAEDAHADTVAGTHWVEFYPANPTQLFEANVCGAAGAAAVTANTQLGMIWQLYRDTTNSVVCVQVNQPVTNPRVAVWSHSGKDAVGDTYGRVLFSVLGKFCQLVVTS